MLFLVSQISLEGISQSLYAFFDNVVIVVGEVETEVVLLLCLGEEGVAWYVGYFSFQSVFEEVTGIAAFGEFYPQEEAAMG